MLNCFIVLKMMRLFHRSKMKFCNYLSVLKRYVVILIRLDLNSNVTDVPFRDTYVVWFVVVNCDDLFVFTGYLYTPQEKYKMITYDLRSEND